MAFKQFLSLLTMTITVSLFLTTTNASSRSLSTSPKTTVLDVVSSLRQTKTILSLDPTRSSLTTTRPVSVPILINSSSPLSLDLYSRDTLVASQYKNYKSLVLSRLDRDSSRVARIMAKIRFVRSDLKPVGNEDTKFKPEDLTSPVVSGASNGSGEYFTRIGIGTPAKETYLVIDTGSDVSWIQCQPCSNCYVQSDPVFDPSSSSTYKSLPCSSTQCSELATSSCRSNKCLYKVKYGDGSFTIGELATETMTFGDSGKLNDFVFGCGHDNEGLFIASAGLLGLGGGDLSITKQIKATSFSYCLVDRDSEKTSSLDFNSVKLSSGDATAPLYRNPMIETFYYIGLTGFSVGGDKVSIPESIFELDDSGSGGVIIDCGTAVTRLQTEVYNSLRDAFIKHTTNFKNATFPLFDTCYDFSSFSEVDVPTLTFHFVGGDSIDLPAENYLIPVDDDGTFCFAFLPTTYSAAIIGNIQQQEIRITYDIANERISFSPDKC